ncbi:hypothetical protein yc1106_08514 [Curvularia clavata]|uniref:2EXR domain-containing protein n=1 Tax=Curvularia clavata TaxID=95742 RepID=A0A9Q8ZFF5_CURCL|nr:hypothetical protein yc1106_08514 [Curvularia clavata]
MATFHPFCRLPKELRLLIWELTVEPRLVDVRTRFIERPHTRLRAASSSTPLPAQLHTCQESRKAGLYERSISDITVLEGKKNESDQRYIWLNLDVDTIFIHGRFEVLWPIAHRIKRLRFISKSGEDPWFFFTPCRELRKFVNALEIHVVVNETDAFQDWHGASEDYYWPCGPENVSFIDPKIGEEMRLMDLELKYDRLAEEESRANGGDYLYKNGKVINAPSARPLTPWYI